MSAFLEYIKNRRTFIRIFLITFIFIFLTISCAGILYYGYTSNRLVHEYNKNNYNLLNQAKTAVGIIVDTMAYAPHSLYTNQQFLTNIRNVPQTGALGKKQIVDSLVNLKNSNIYIDSVVLYIPESMAVFSTNYGFSSIEDFPDREWIVNNAVSDMDIRMFGKRKNYKSKYDENLNINVFTLIKKLPYTSSMKAVLIINFDIDKIYENIVSKLNFGSDTEIFAIGSSGDIVFQSKNSTLIGELLANKDFIDMIRNNQQNREISLNRTKYFAAAIFSEHMDSYIIGISSYKELTNMISTIKNIILINGLILLLFLVACSMFVLDRTSKPIDDLLNFILGKRRNPYEKLDIYGLTKNIVKETFEGYSKLQSKMERMLPFFQERLLHSLMTRNDLENEEINKRLEEYEIRFKFKWFFVLSVDIVNLYAMDDNGRNPNLKRIAVHEAFSNILSGDDIAAYKVDVSDERVAFIINVNEQNLQKTRNQLEKLLRSAIQLLENEYGIETAIGISERGDNISAIGRLYKNSLNALNYRLIGNTTSIVFIDSINQRQKVFEEFDAFFEDRLENIILAGDTERAVRVVKDTFAGYRKEKRTTALRFQNGALYFAIILVKIAEKINLDLFDISDGEGNILQMVGGLKSVHDAETFFIKNIEMMCRHCQKEKEKEKDRLFYYQKIIEYIDENYTQDISIDSAAQVIGISPSYIFKILSEHSRLSFTEYTTKKRMEKACELLHQNCKVQDIAPRIGYSSTTYFIHVFKKYMGCTPSEYKRINALI